MNTGYYENLSENFNQAVQLLQEDYSHEQLIELLKTGNIVQKQFGALRLTTVKSVDDATVLISNLTGQDGKIREVVSLRLKEFLADNKIVDYFKQEKFYPIFLDAIIDINGNICRNIISAILNLKTDENFCKIFCSKLVVLTNNLLDKIEHVDFREGKYKVNKEVFKLYWCLETICYFYDKISLVDLKGILLRAKNIEEYTIREKVAKILTNKIDDEELKNAKTELRNDKNYYVRRF